MYFTNQLGVDKKSQKFPSSHKVVMIKC